MSPAVDGALTVVGHVGDMWDRDLGHFAALGVPDQLRLIALAVEDLQGPEAYIRMLRDLGEELEAFAHLVEPN